MTVKPERRYRYYDLLMAAYVCILLCANLIGAQKVTTVQLPLFGAVTFAAGVLFFPLSYFSATSSPRSMATPATAVACGPVSQRWPSLR